VQRKKTTKILTLLDPTITIVDIERNQVCGIESWSEKIVDFLRNKRKILYFDLSSGAPYILY